jgi:hypothetical protein
MITIERSPQRLVLRSGSTTVTLDKDARKAAMTRKLLLWARKPLERPLSDMTRVSVDANVDRSSGVELCSTMLVMQDGSAWALPHKDRKNATAAADATRDFLSIPS